MTSLPPKLEVAWLGRQTGEARVVVSWLDFPTAQAMTEMRQRVTNFCRLGSLGAFPLPEVVPAASSLSLVDESVAGKEDTAYLVRFAAIDPSCFGVLRNLVWRVSGTKQPVRRIVIRDDAASSDVVPEQIEEPDFESAADFYPPESDEIELDVEEEEGSYDLSKSRRCVIEFSDPVCNSVIQNLRDRLQVLFDVLADGGFSPPVRPADEADVWLETAQRFDKYSYEFIFSVFDASEETWNVVINLVEAFSSTVQNVSRIEID